MPRTPIRVRTIPAAAQSSTNTTGEMSKKIESTNTTRNRTSAPLSFTAPFQSFSTALKIRTQTQTRMGVRGK